MFQIFARLLLLSLFGCSSAQIPKSHEVPFEPLPDRKSIELNWERVFDGFFSGIRAARDGRALVVWGKKKESEGYRATAYSNKGEELWSHDFSEKILSADLFDGGEFAVVSLEPGQVIGLDEQGKQSFKIQKKCLLWVLDQSFLCQKREIESDQLALELCERNGKCTKTYPIKDQTAKGVRKVFLSTDRKTFALLIDQDRFHYLNSDLTPIWKKKFPGEVVDADIGQGEKPYVGVLYNLTKEKTMGRSERNGQQWSVIDQTGNAVLEKGLLRNTIGIKLATEVAPIQGDIPQGAGVIAFFYGNGPFGQYLSAWDREKEIWSHIQLPRALFVSALQRSPTGVVNVFEDREDGSRPLHAHLFGFDALGRMEWDFPLETQNLGLFMDVGYREDELMLFVATDRSRVMGFSY